MVNTVNWNQSFTAAPTRAKWFVTELLNRLPALTGRPRLDVLDLGCGTGALALQLVESCPNAHVTGVDISTVSIEQAIRESDASPHRDRLRFLAQDYMESDLGRFDVVYADGCLHLIPQSNDLLFAKLADGLKPGGFLVFSMPKLSPYNRCLGIVRRCLRLTRSRLTDRMILMIARLLHGREKTDSFLLERVHYMYFLPHRVMDSAMERVLDEQFDLHCQGAHPYPHASIGQFKHGLWVFQKGQSSGLVDAKAA